uniref:Uncharacterized protein n=1 Tax=Daucus carota subsp. sativus TaxID=79200 RepID=A0A166J9W3_DAUCS
MANSSNHMVQYEGFLTVVPHRPTFPRPSVRISTEKDREAGLLRQCFRMILCYEKASSDDSGWMVAGWTKTSIGIALSEKPVLAGRLRRAEDGGLELVSNDSGVRLVEARIALRLDEFGGLRNKEEERKQLVTNFKCGAYAIGISCSILLADPFSMSSFLKRWSEIHMNLVTESLSQKLPLFYLPNFGKPNSTQVYSPNYEPAKETSRQTLIFKFANLTVDNEMQRIVALSCIDKVNRRLGKKVTSDFSLLVKNPNNDMLKIDTISVKEVLSLESFKNLTGINSKDYSWGEYIDADGINIAKGNKPTETVCWISSPDEEDLVMIISSESNMTVIVTVSTTNDA